MANPLAESPLAGPAFDALFANKIEPKLRELEIERRASVRLSCLIWLGFVALLAAEALATGALTHGHTYWPDARVWAVTLVAGALGGLIPMGDVTRKTKLHLIASLCEPLGLTYQLKPPMPGVVQRLIDLGLLPATDNRYVEDMFEGRRGQSSFMICDCQLHKDVGKNARRVFRGQVFLISLPQRYLGKTVMLRDSGWLNSFICPDGLRRVGLEDPHFEKLWEVFSDDQIESRAILTPSFMEQMIVLEGAYAGSNIRCGFQDGDLMIAVEGTDRFEAEGMFSNMDLRARALGMAGDFAAIIGVIDVVVPPAAH